MLPGRIENGDWQTVDHMIDYRSEWLSEILVERATWAPETPIQQHIEDQVVRAPGYVWFRFWLAEEGQLVEKYFDAEGNDIGMYIPICMPITRKGKQLSTQSLTLALWLASDGRVVVLNEDAFDQGADAGELGPVEVEQAEFSIRKLTAAVAQSLFPPSIVRNFNIQANVA